LRAVALGREEERMAEGSASSYARPARVCDVVMKGGITSGVVYPLAICELAKDFRLSSIGGTSAGAIAAAVAAAAEYGRHSATGGFGVLEELPAFLGGTAPGETRTNLLRLFQPQTGTKRLFGVFLALLEKERVRHGVAAVCWAFPLALLLGAAPGLALAVGAWLAGGGPASGLGVAAALLLALVGAAITVGVALVRSALASLRGNFFGLCSGMPGADGRGFPSLTVWLTRYLNEVAGLDPEAPPLTFADLWGEGRSKRPHPIRLEVMTTCLTMGRPFRLPLRDDEDVRESRQFYFRPDELRALFPEPVVGWMEAHARKPEDHEARGQHERFAALGFLPLPEPRDVPVVVAVRMSLSFPLLLSAVPLHAVDFSRKVGAEERRPQVCWFSDGGICSNFPVHFFDAPLPRWPTFAINLTEKHPDYPAGFWMLNRNQDQLRPIWTAIDAGSWRGVARFLGAMLDTMRGWSDATQAQLPGYRDRIANIALADGDGGLNLDMPHERIERLGEWGADAGRELCRRFASGTSDSDLTWENHRWVRLRTALAAAEGWLQKLETACAEPQGGDRGFEEWLASSGSQDPPSYPWSPKPCPADGSTQRERAAALLAALRDAAIDLRQCLAEGGLALSHGAPRPRPELRTRPRV
jgi:predicted acylesterase/phospholipase RssA